MTPVRLEVHDGSLATTGHLPPFRTPPDVLRGLCDACRYKAPEAPAPPLRRGRRGGCG